MDIALNTATSDLDLSNGDLYLIEENDAIAQHVSQRFKTFLAEWFLDETVGVPYFDYIFRKNPNPVVIDAVLKRVALESPGVVELTSWELTLDSARRELSLDFTARSEEGFIEFADVIGV
jgi:hypothetical protein